MSVIYPEGEEWYAVDQFAKEEDAEWVKSTEEWTDFISFLEGYFSADRKRQ
jgi:hypothetical protein